MTRIMSVRERNGLFRIRDSQGVLWATRDGWLASLADRFRESGEPVTLHGRSGWFYADLRAITSESDARSAS